MMKFEDLEKRLAGLEDFKTYPDDVWVVTYPKCGTTWAMQIVKLLRSNGIQNDVDLSVSLPWLEKHGSFDESCIIQPRGFKSHMPYSKCPGGPPHQNPCKYIYVARNPKDVATSYYYHLRALALPDLDKETFWSKFVKGDMLYGCFFDHVMGWWEHREDNNVLFMKYEDMKKDLVSCISRIASFIEADVSREMIADIAHQTTFDNMRKNPLANNTWSKINRHRNETDFMRKGAVGDWKNFLTEEQSLTIDELCESRFVPVGLYFEFE